jgi:hypothetical protein
MAIIDGVWHKVLRKIDFQLPGARRELIEAIEFVYRKARVRMGGS